MHVPEHLAIVADGLCRRFGSFVAVDGVSFQVERGEIFGLLGSNGAGKTTTIRMLCGLLTPSGGRAWVAGLDAVEASREVRRRIGYVSQQCSLYPDLTVGENLCFWGAAYGLRGAHLARRLAWAHEAWDLHRWTTTLVAALPPGVARRVAVACALLHEPPVLFLDEPTSGVDPLARRWLWDLLGDLAGKGTAQVVTTHLMEEAERCHRVALMHAGRLLAVGTVEELKGSCPPGCVVHLPCAQPAPVAAVARRSPGVVDASLFADGVRVVAREAQAIPHLLEALASQGLVTSHPEPVRPSLEEAFLWLVAAR